jgi:hypothetical protein
MHPLLFHPISKDAPMSNPTSPPGDSARDSQGRFLHDNPGGPGNPFARQVALLRKALIAAVSPDDFTAIAGKLKDKALAGDLAATKLLFSYVLGKPTVMPDPDEVENKQLKEQEKLETAIGRIVLPILRRGAFEDDEPEPRGPNAAIGTPTAPTVNKATSVASPAPRPQGPNQTKLQPAPGRPIVSGTPRQEPIHPQPSTNRSPATPPPGGANTARMPARDQPTGKLADLLANDDTPFRPGCTQVDLTIVSSP